jgi:hypothetical protein
MDDLKKEDKTMKKNTFYYLDVIRELPVFYKIETHLSLKSLRSLLKKKAKIEANRLGIKESYFSEGHCENPDYFTFDLNAGNFNYVFSLQTFLSKFRSEARLTSQLAFINMEINKEDLE